MRVDRLSRHLYDVAKMSNTKIEEQALADRPLYETIVQHRYNFNRLGGVDYNLHQPQTIDPIPIESVLDDWGADYNKMVEQMIYETSPPSFVELLTTLKRLKEKINALPWRFQTKF